MKTKLFLLVLFVMVSFFGSSKNRVPYFKGGEEALSAYILKSVTYPEYARDRCIEGKVYVRFKVNRSGIVSDVKVVKKVSRVLDEEAVRVISTMPRWESGRKSVEYTIPIVFQLK